MIDYYACIKLKFPTIPDEAFSLVDINGNISISKWDSAYGQQPTMLELDQLHLSVVKNVALNEVKNIRRQGLNKAALSAGILAIYDSNYEASIALLSGHPETCIKNGMCADKYLEGFGARLGMSAIQFAQYVVNENKRVGPTAYEIEKRYLALTYGGDQELMIIPINFLSDELVITAAVESYRSYCQV